MKTIFIGVMAAALLITGCKKTEMTTTESTASTQTKATEQTRSYVGLNFIASGNEPFWQVNIDGKTLSYATAETPNGTKLKAKREKIDDTLQYTSALNGGEFVITIAQTRCEDDMSGEKFHLTATLVTSGNTYGGCAKMK